jgi:hypothetical protein
MSLAIGSQLRDLVIDRREFQPTDPYSVRAFLTVRPRDKRWSLRRSHVCRMLVDELRHIALWRREPTSATVDGRLSKSHAIHHSVTRVGAVESGIAARACPAEAPQSRLRRR